METNIIAITVSFLAGVLMGALICIATIDDVSVFRIPLTDIVFARQNSIFDQNNQNDQGE
jgi:hypothetical protein